MEVNETVTAMFVPCKTFIGQGYSLPITVLVPNDGNFTGTFNVSAYANATSIASENFTLPSGRYTTVSFTWNTGGVPYGNYTIDISAYAWPVPGESNTTINISGGWVVVTIPGDINGDFKVSLQDLASLANAYGSRPGDANWNPNADIDWNNYAGLSDLAILANHYGQH